MSAVGIVIIAGLVFGKIAQLFRAPAVTGYLIGGIVIGPAVLNLLNDTKLVQLSIASEFALALIAFSIGAEFNLNNLKKLGKNIITITISQALITYLCVYIAMTIVFHQSVSFSILLAAISCATAPAATIMVINQYKADGPLVRTILPVVAIDDAVCIFVFGISLSIAKALQSGVSVTFFELCREPLVEISLSLLLGGIGGFLFSLSYKFFRSDNETLIAILGIIILFSGLAISLNLSTLLTCMMLGAIVANLLSDRKRIFNIVDHFSPPIFVLFFTLAGAGLHLSELRHLGTIGFTYILARAVGKFSGAALGAKLAHAPSVISKYLGLGLMPQAGVAIGLATIVSRSFSEIGPMLTTIILGGVVVFEIIGPFFAKYALEKANEINGKQAIIASTHD